jgi:hypothetical protein
MKHRIYYSFILIVVTLLSCSDTGFYSEPAQSALNGLNDLGREPMYNLDWINKKQITQGENAVEGDYIEMVGWAADPDSKQLASKVFISIGGNIFSTQYGVDRDDVANYYQNPALKKSGFIVKIARTTLPPGVYPVEVKVIGSDLSSYFSSPVERVVMLRI